MTSTFTWTRGRAVVAVLAAAFVLTGAAACGSSSTKGASTDSTAGAGGSTPATPGGRPAAGVDPCQWYTADEMGALVGFTVTMTKKETPQGLGFECLYDSQAKFTSVTVRPTTAASYDQIKAGAAAAGLGGKQIAFPGVGDAAYHNGSADRGNQSVSFSAKKGKAGIDVELATSGTAIPSVDKAIEITSTIAKKALG